jgi:hypothetical protein
MWNCAVGLAYIVLQKITAVPESKLLSNDYTK